MSDLRARLQSTFGDAYTLERELGGGGMSRVFVAREAALNRDVVVKVIKPELLEGLSASRFAREVQLAARLQQANIVPVLSAGESGGVPWYTMPFVRGESLRARLARGDAVPVAEAVSILRDVARALAYAHGEGVVHRDIKPENILLSGGTAVVTDFGIAKAVEVSSTLPPGTGIGATLTQLGMALGTPAYMAPEQAAGDAATDHRADLYAWGLVAWELLAGRHPFAGRTSAQALLAAHMAEAPASVDAARAGVPPALSALVARCLEKDPARRPSSASELLHVLDGISTPSEIPKATASTSRVAMFRWIAAAAALVVIVAGIAWRTNQSRATASAGDATRTIVVMPFDNLGPASDAYFADGVSEEIASRIGQIPGIRVVGRASAARLKATNKSAEDIARELGAEYVLTGSVRWDRAAGAQSSDAMVRITPALMRAPSGERVWGEPVTEKLTDVFKVQADVAERVAAALSVRLAASTETSLRRADTQDPDARDATLLGRNLLVRRGDANIRQAILQFQRAIGRDSNYARAWAGLAEAYAVGGTYGIAGLDSTGNAARRAVRLDSLSPEAWVALATTLQVRMQLREALASADRAIALDPSFADAHSRRGMTLLAMGRVSDADQELRQATQLDPLVAAFNLRIGYVDLALNRVDSVRQRVQRMRVLEPTNAALFAYGATMLLEVGLTREAIDLCLDGVSKEEARACRALETIADPTRRAEAVRIVDEWSSQASMSVVNDPVFFASVYAHLGEADKAFDLLRRLQSFRNQLMFAYINSPWMAPLKSDPRWQTVVVAAQNR